MEAIVSRGLILLVAIATSSLHLVNSQQPPNSLQPPNVQFSPNAQLPPNSQHGPRGSLPPNRQTPPQGGVPSNRMMPPQRGMPPNHQTLPQGVQPNRQMPPQGGVGSNRQMSPQGGAQPNRQMSPQGGAQTNRQMPPLGNEQSNRLMPPQGGAQPNRQMPPQGGGQLNRQMPPQGGGQLNRQMPPQGGGLPNRQMPPQGGGQLNRQMPPLGGGQPNRQMPPQVGGQPNRQMPPQGGGLPNRQMSPLGGGQLNRQMPPQGGGQLNRQMPPQTQPSGQLSNPLQPQPARARANVRAPIAVTVAPGSPYNTVPPDMCWSCNFEEEQCYRPHPTDCRKYIKCVRHRGTSGSMWVAISVWCGFGTFWDQGKYTCETASLVTCSYDPCLSAQTTTYAHELSCRTYWECRDGRSTPRCCQYGDSFVEGQGCVPQSVTNSSCYMPCPSIVLGSTDPNFSTTAQPACNLKAADADGRTFIGEGYSFAMPCAPSTRFDAASCTCIYDNFERPACGPGVHIDFDSPTVVDKSGRNIWVDPKNINTQDGSGRFVGNSVITVHRYSHADLGLQVLIQLRFFGVDGGPKRQVLVSNCRTKESATATHSPSVALELDKTGNKVVFFAAVKDQPEVSFSLPYQPGAWNNVEYRYDNKELRGTIQTLSGGKTDQVTDSGPLKGRIDSSIEPLRIGSCNNGDGFVGYMDEVTFYTCLPPPPAKNTAQSKPTG